MTDKKYTDAVFLHADGQKADDMAEMILQVSQEQAGQPSGRTIIALQVLRTMIPTSSYFEDGKVEPAIMLAEQFLSATIMTLLVAHKMKRDGASLENIKSIQSIAAGYFDRMNKLGDDYLFPETEVVDMSKRH